VVTRHRIAFLPRSLCLLAAAVAVSAPAAAQQPSDHRLVWNEAWPRFRAWEYAATGVLVAGGLALEYLTRQPREPNWESPLPGELAVRDALAARTRSGREAAGVLSDYMWITAQWYTQVVDALVITFLVDDQNFDVAWQMSAMNAEAMALGFVLTRGAHRLVARSRPLELGCENDPAYDGLCPFSGSTAGFPSGHASMAFVGAGLTCAHHQYLPIYGDAAADLSACLGVTALAATTGVLRIVSDSHYTSDVIAASLLGFAVGYAVPVLLHYGFGEPAREYGVGQNAAALGTTRVTLVSAGF